MKTHKQLKRLRILGVTILIYIALSIVFLTCSLFINMSDYYIYMDIFTMIFCLAMLGFNYENWHEYIAASKEHEKNVQEFVQHHIDQINLTEKITVKPKQYRKRRMQITGLYLVSVGFCICSMVWVILKYI